MKQKILCVTGWGGGIQVLHPLQSALQTYGYDVDVIQIFNVLDTNLLEQYVERYRDFDVILGWSLGGQIAAILVDQIQKKYAEQKVLISLASNPCFVADQHWQSAMDPAVFLTFKQGFEQDPLSTLKNFAYLVCQGTQTIKADLATLQSLIQPQSMTLLKQGLHLLEYLNVEAILSNYRGHQYHCFAEQDVLVPHQVIQNIQQMPAKLLSVELIQGSHGFPIFEKERMSCKIHAFLQTIFTS